MHRRISFLLVLPLLAVFSGCVGYRRKPILDRQVLHDLQAIRLEGLKASEGELRQNVPDVSNSTGLSSDDAVAVALYLNPDLRVFRKERGVAEGELVSASLLPNPEITTSALLNLPGVTTLGSGAVAATILPFRPGERGARVIRARAKIEQVQSQIAAEEWKLKTDVRKAYLTVWALEEQLRIDDTAVQLQERLRKFFRDKRALGDASRLDLNIINIEFGRTIRERELIASEKDRARQELNRLLGLPPTYELKLTATSDPLGYKPFVLDANTLESLMVGRRAQLAAAKQEYEQAEQTLRLAYIQRIPWFRLGPSYERESGGGEGTTNRLGVGLGLDLPILNRNQGVIAAEEANRDKLREGFTAQVHQARGELNEAYRNLRAQERLIHLYQETIKPALDENAQLTEAGFQLGEFNLVQLITTQDKVLSSRREFVTTELEYWKAVADLELAVGAQLSEPGTKSKTP